MQELNKLSGFEIAKAIEIIIWGYGSYGYGTHGDENTLHSSLHLKQDEIEKNICDNNLLWAPDGDEAFDDGSRIIHFDVSDTEVRLVAYTAFGDDSLYPSSLTDVILDADFFYETLNSWATNFYKEWRARVAIIGDYAFYKCASLTSIEIPDSVTSIGYATFEWCDKLILILAENSYGHKYALKNDIEFVFE